MSKNFVNPTKVITGVNTRWSYANVWEAKSINGGAPKYSVSLIIPKTDTKTIEKIKAAIQAAYEEGESKLKGNGKTVPALSVLKTPLRDGDLERPDDEAYANSYFVNANSGTAPGIVDADRQPIIDHSEVYSGVYGRASINFYAFNSNGNKCSTPHLDEETIKTLYLKALRILGEERDEIIATFDAIKDEMYATTELEVEQAALQQEVMVVTELVEQCISENAHVAQNQKDYQKKYDALSDRYDRTKERLDKVSGRIMERQAKREMIESFLRDLAEMDADVHEFTDDLWFNLLDHVTVFSKKDVRFTFKNGTEVSVK